MPSDRCRQPGTERLLSVSSVPYPPRGARPSDPRRDGASRQTVTGDRRSLKGATDLSSSGRPAFLLGGEQKQAFSTGLPMGEERLAKALGGGTPPSAKPTLTTAAGARPPSTQAARSSGATCRGPRGHGNPHPASTPSPSFQGKRGAHHRSRGTRTYTRARPAHLQAGECSGNPLQPGTPQTASCADHPHSLKCRTCRSDNAMARPRRRRAQGRRR